jgi:prepilin-type N-terminal cleavage/methylation domain-containing protein
MRKAKTKGFTLVEVLASVVILTGAVVPLITFSADSLSASLEIERGVKSVLLAEGEMEKIKSVLRESFDTDFTAWSNDLGNNYLASRTSTEVSSTLKIIEVSVGYDTDKDSSLGADEVIVTFSTQYAQRS